MADDLPMTRRFAADFGDVNMLMRLVRDEPDVELDEVRADGAENEPSVLSDLKRQAATATTGSNGRRSRKARMPMSSKTQVIAVPEFGLSEGEPGDDRETQVSSSGDAVVEDSTRSTDLDATDAVAAVTSSDDMTDGVIPPQENPEADDSDSAGGDVDVSMATLEALLMSTHHPLTPARLNEIMGAGSIRAIRNAVQALNESYEQSGRSFRIEQVAGGYQILTLPEHGEALRRLHQKEADAKLTKAALETLSIIAYKQPILRADVEAIRGVACGETIRSLMEKHLVKIAGRAEEPGRPILYGTTKRFLELFGLNSLKDLPKPEEFKPQG
ncbi:SMC-Scp complex subunit ScpB [Humisphaera borealis]|nr:SMC-Scp complex subunit ScpB [Humisphaera borealis]